MMKTQNTRHQNKHHNINSYTEVDKEGNLLNKQGTKMGIQETRTRTVDTMG